MKLRTISACILSATTLILAGCSDAVVHSSAPATNVYLLGTDSQNNPQISGFPATATGTVTPSTTITLPSGNDPDYSQLAVDNAGNLYIAETIFSPQTGSVTTVYSYAPTSSTTPTPVRQFTSSVLNDTVNGMAVDSAGEVFIAIGGTTVYKFDASATGTATPTATITFGGGRIATDANGNLYVYDDNVDNQVEVYNAGFVNAAVPTRIINSTVPLEAKALAADANGNLYLAGRTADNDETPEIQVFSSTATGTIAPTRTIAGASTTLIAPRDIKVNANGTIFVLDQTSQPNGVVVPQMDLRNANILQFASTASGNVAPAGTSTSTAFAHSNYMAIH